MKKLILILSVTLISNLVHGQKMFSRVVVITTYGKSTGFKPDSKVYYRLELGEKRFGWKIDSLNDQKTAQVINTLSNEPDILNFMTSQGWLRAGISTNNYQKVFYFTKDYPVE
jgi:hypothetical protein